MGCAEGRRRVWGKEEGVPGQKNCVGREEIASKAERVPHVERGHPLGVIPKVCAKVTHSWMTQRHEEARPRLGVDSSRLLLPPHGLSSILSLHPSSCSSQHSRPVLGTDSIVKRIP